MAFYLLMGDDYVKIKEQFKDDIIISSLCIECIIRIEEVIYKRLITNKVNLLGSDIHPTFKVDNCKKR